MTRELKIQILNKEKKDLQITRLIDIVIIKSFR